MSFVSQKALCQAACCHPCSAMLTVSLHSGQRTDRDTDFLFADSRLFAFWADHLSVSDTKDLNLSTGSSQHTHHTYM